MKTFIIVTYAHRADNYSYLVINAEDEKGALLNFYKKKGGSKILDDEKLEIFAETFSVLDLIKLYNEEYDNIVEFGEYEPIFGKPI